ncbi:hypothetical protein [Haloglomus salinum]|uniref:hypothetical protein n=1 Tax=Haloglomus salinum TaxID=2962673 RepID=UPI0020C99B2F|nr:hypothetical protein [Haloglomus salinum]
MATPPTGNERDGGFLQKNERAYLADSDCYPVEYADDFSGENAKAKSRIKNEVTSIEGMRSVLFGMTVDLRAIQLFMFRDESIDSKQWSTQTLPAVQSELEQLRDAVDSLIEIAENDNLQSEYEELQDATSHLYENVDRATAGFSSGVVRAKANNRGLGADTIRSEFEKRKEQQEGLMAIINNGGGPEILEHIAENGPCSLSGRRINDKEAWGSFAYREFVDRGLATRETENVAVGNDVEYELTDAGERVVQTWQQLKQTTAVEMEREANPKASDRELVRNALHFHFDLSGGPIYPF